MIDLIRTFKEIWRDIRMIRTITKKKVQLNKKTARQVVPSTPSHAILKRYREIKGEEREKYSKAMML